MIPKFIHYCWFGRGPKSELVKKCIDSWKRILPEYQVKEWNEDNFDVNSVPYVKEAYECRKWAFVTDYVRLYALYHEGGIYMDSDVEVLKPLDRFLSDIAFTGYESSGSPLTGIMASERGGEWVRQLMRDYDGKRFCRDRGTIDCTPNTVFARKVMLQKGMRIDRREELVENYVHLYPADYFCPKCADTGIITLTENTYAIHHFTSTWLSFGGRVYRWFSVHGHPALGYYVTYFMRRPDIVILDVCDFLCKKFKKRVRH